MRRSLQRQSTAQIAFDDFDTNAGGTLNMLERARRYAPEAPFIHMSTNKVNGDGPNHLSIAENEKRVTDRRQIWTYTEGNRVGDHICYYSDLRMMKSHCPNRDVTKTLQLTIAEIATS